jgi:hypothetical protein
MNSGGPAAPAEGAAYVDLDGVRWVVRSITRSENFPDFYLVHLRFVRADGAEGTEVYGPREFAAVVRERGLVATDGKDSP